MSISNTTKSKSAAPPAEPFKRAVAACLRAIAGKPELEVGFAAEKPIVSPARVRLPEPPRRMSRGDAAILRGHADRHDRDHQDHHGDDHRDTEEALALRKRF